LSHYFKDTIKSKILFYRFLYNNYYRLTIHAQAKLSNIMLYLPLLINTRLKSLIFESEFGYFR